MTFAGGDRDLARDFGNRAAGSGHDRQGNHPEEEPNETDFGFTSDLPGEGNDSFTLRDDGTRGPVAVSPGTYQVTEDDPSADGYELSDISCSDEGQDPEDSSDEGRTATIRVQPGEQVTCTYTNTEQGQVTIAKETDPEEEPNETDFGFTSDLPGEGNDSFTLRDDGTRGPVAVSPGTYQVTEDDPSADGYELSDISCSDEGQDPEDSSYEGRTATIRVQPGEQVTCTYTNTEQGQVTIAKETDPEEEPNETDFGFTSDLPGRATTASR